MPFKSAMHKIPEIPYRLIARIKKTVDNAQDWGLIDQVFV